MIMSQRNRVGIYSFILNGQLQNSSVRASPLLCWNGFHHGIPLSSTCFASNVLSSTVPTMMATVAGDEKKVFNILLNCMCLENQNRVNIGPVKQRRNREDLPIRHLFLRVHDRHRLCSLQSIEESITREIETHPKHRCFSWNYYLQTVCM